MTMNAMVEYLEKKGFKAEKVYLKDDKAYRFTIRKNGKEASAIYKYNPYKSAVEVNPAQRKFLDDLINQRNDWYGEESECDVNWSRHVDILFDTRHDAEVTLEDMRQQVNTYGYVTMAYMYELVGLNSNYTQSKIGWTSLFDAEIQRVRLGYIIKLHAPADLGDMFANKKKENDMNKFDAERRLSQAVLKKMTGTIEINDVRVPVQITRIETNRPDSLPQIKCDVLTPTKEMQQEEYWQQDFETTYKIYRELFNAIYGKNAGYSSQIKDVIFSPPATIVKWKDGTKTVVKAEGEDYDPEKGLAMAISKKVLGNNYSYYNTFKKWLKKAPTKND